jgi:hypothetical protein
VTIFSDLFREGISRDTADLLRGRFYHEGTQPYHPKLVFAVAQPGAGKSTLANSLSRQMSNGEAWWRLDKDSLRKFCPEYQEAIKNPFTMSLTTNRSAQACYNTILRSALRSKQNLLVEGGVRSAVFFSLLGTAIRLNGYKIDMHIVGVHWRDSMLGIINRFETGLATSHSARWVCLRKHELAVRNVVGMARNTQRFPVCHNITVHQRCCASDNKVSWKSSAPTSASKALEVVHNEVWGQQRREDHLHLAASLRDRAEARKEYSPAWYRDLLTLFVRQAEDLVAGKDRCLNIDSHVPLTKIESARLKGARVPLENTQYSLNRSKKYGVVKGL